MLPINLDLTLQLCVKCCLRRFLGFYCWRKRIIHCIRCLHCICA